jgi:hypothetical protein
MAQWTVWRRYTREVIDKLPNRIGTYEIAARNKQVLANGKSDSSRDGVRGRLIARLIHNQHPTGYFFRCKYASLLDSPEQMEAETVAQHRTKTGRKNFTGNNRSPRKDRFDILNIGLP